MFVDARELTLTVRHLCLLCDLMGIVYAEPDIANAEDAVTIKEAAIIGEHGGPDYEGLVAFDSLYPEEGSVALEDHDE